MQNPAWTGCLAFLWVLIIPALIWTHVSVGKVLSATKDLRVNVAKGFDSTLKFDLLETETKNIQSSASTALGKCHRSPTTCSEQTSYPAGEVEVDTTAEKAKMQEIFTHTLNTVKKVTSDKYFGVADLKHTDKRLSQITYSMNAISSVMLCSQAVPIYCSIYDSAGEILHGMDSVHMALYRFKTCDSVKDWRDHEPLFIWLHFLPWILIVGMACFSFFWWRGGVCFWCGGEDRPGNIAVALYLLLWATNCVTWLVVAMAGYVIKYDGDNIDVKILVGEPNLKDTIDHLQTHFPYFWKLVFEDIADGAGTLLACAWFSLVVTILIGLFSVSECVMFAVPEPVKEVEETPKQQAQPQKVPPAAPNRETQEHFSEI